MRILFVANEVPFPPDNGVRIVSHHAMRMMHESGHQLALAVLTEDTDNVAQRYVEAAAICQRDMSFWMPLPRRSRISVQLMASLMDRPFFVERYRCAPFRRRLSALVAEFRPDVIHFDIITLAQYLMVAPTGVGTVASINDSNALTLENALSRGRYRGAARIYREAQLRQVRRYEATWYLKFHAVHLMSEIDASYLKKLNPLINTVVISNGADDSLFGLDHKTRGRTDLIFVAKLVGENLEGLQHFLEVSWPLIESELPDVTMHIVGALGAEAQAIKARFAGRRNVLFHGYVDNLADVYQRCGIAVVPINKDCGIINKVIEAMAAGLAVVGFDSAFAGIRVASRGEHFLTAGDYADFGRVAVSLIRDLPRLRSIQQAAHALATQYYTWASRAIEYESMYRHSAERAMAERRVAALP